MLRDITIGQYFPGKSVIHRLDSRVKIILVVASIVMLFLATNPSGLAVGILFLLLTLSLIHI